jgi:hypothetical protein
MRQFTIDRARLGRFAAARDASLAAARDVNRDRNAVLADLSALRVQIRNRDRMYPSHSSGPTEAEGREIARLEAEAARLVPVTSTSSELAQHAGLLAAKVAEYAARKGVSL